MIKKIYLSFKNIKSFLIYYLSRYFLYFRAIPHRKLLKIKKLKNQNINCDRVVIFGSGKILNELTFEEKKKISKSKVIFMNKNLIFWKYINVWPSYFFLADTPIKSNKSLKIFLDTLNVVKNSENNPPIFLLENYYKFALPSNIKTFFFNYNKSSNLKWAKHLDDIMFGYHGSLTTLLNLVDVLNLGKKIMLVGFDMNGRDYFFEKDKNFEDYLDNSYFSEGSFHPNLEKINGKNMLTYWKIISDNLNYKKIDIYCNNPNSILVKKKLVNYKSIDKFYEN